MSRRRAALIDVRALMNTPPGRDEDGTPAELIETCEDCGCLYRAGGWHECPDGGDRDG